MIAVDSSAVLAIIWREPQAAALRNRLALSGESLISTANALEIQLVLSGSARLSDWRDVERLLMAYRIAIVPFDVRQLAFARDAVLRFGRGRHPAKLNFGDCFAYALAKSESMPLLYVGDDFALTDIEAA